MIILSYPSRICAFKCQDSLIIDDFMEAITDRILPPPTPPPHNDLPRSCSVTSYGLLVVLLHSGGVYDVTQAPLWPRCGVRTPRQKRSQLGLCLELFSLGSQYNNLPIYAYVCCPFYCPLIHHHHFRHHHNNYISDFLHQRTDFIIIISPP